MDRPLDNSKPYLCGRCKGCPGMFKTVDMVFGKFDTGQFKELWPSDTIDPFTHSFIFLGMAGP